MNDIGRWGLFVSVLSLVVDIIAYVWPHPSKPVIRKVILYILGPAFFMGLGVYLGSIFYVPSYGEFMDLKNFSATYEYSDKAPNPIPVDYSNNNIKATGVELRSTQDNNGNTNPNQSIGFIWKHPIQQSPIQGLIIQIMVQPVPDPDVKPTLVCYFLALYQLNSNTSYQYESSPKFVNLGEWNTLTWDFSGLIWEDPKSAWNQSWLDTRTILENNGHYYLSITRRLNEQMIDNAILAKKNNASNSWTDQLQNVEIKCNVSANDLHSETTNSIFRGNIFLRNSWIQSYAP